MIKLVCKQCGAKRTGGCRECYLLSVIERAHEENHRLSGGSPRLAEKERLNRENHRLSKEVKELRQQIEDERILALEDMDKMRGCGC